jgi:hypothetical protein
MSTALQRMGVDPHAQRANRFFANKEHERLFGIKYFILKRAIRDLEAAATPKHVQALQEAVNGSDLEIEGMDPKTKEYLAIFCQKQGVACPGT